MKRRWKYKYLIKKGWKSTRAGMTKSEATIYARELRKDGYKALPLITSGGTYLVVFKYGGK